MDKTIIHKGRSLFYRSLGEGKPVVLLHGFAEDGEIWSSQVNYLQERCRLIIPDLPGSGRSEFTDDVSMEAMAEAVNAVVAEEKITDVIMIGHSMGGYVTLAYAEKFPNLVKAFGLFHSTAYADSEDKKAKRIKNITSIESHGSRKFLKQSVPGLFSSDFKDAHPEIVEQLIDRYKTFDLRSLAAYQQAIIQRTDKTDVLKRTSKPVLFIIGKHDNAVPFDDSLQLCHLPALSYIHILEQSGHMGMLEETQKSNRALQHFLSDIR